MPQDNALPAGSVAAQACLYKFCLIREHLMVKVAAAIHERGWNQTEAARFLSVSQPRISDLMRAKAGKFTVDTLIQWLFALGKDVEIVVTKADEKPSSSHPDSARALEAAEEISFFTAAIALDPKSVYAYQNRGDRYMELKEFALAIGDYTRGAELAPLAPGPRNQRAIAFRMSGQVKAAMQEAEELVRGWPDYSGGYSQRAAAFVLLNQLDEAIADYSTAIEMEPDRPGSYCNRAAIYDRLGRYQEAINDFDRVLIIKPSLTYIKDERDRVAKKLEQSL